jgi:hypothetical protein
MSAPVAARARGGASAAPNPPANVKPPAMPISATPAASDRPPGAGSMAETFEQLLAGDLDKGFAAIERKSHNAPPKPGVAAVDLSDVRQLFGQLAANHMRQVRDFMIELRWGPAPVTWIAICDPCVRSLQSAATKLEFDPLAAALDGFARAMQAEAGLAGTTIESVGRERLLAAYGELVELMPDTFALDLDRNQREGAILSSLLAQVPGVRKITIDKLYAAGLSTLETMLLATAEDVAATTDIPRDVAAQIVDRFRAYREQSTAAAVDASRTHEREQLASLVTQLGHENEEYERAAAGWTKSDAERKKELREARTKTILEIHVLLARLGETELVRDLEKMPFERKLVRLGEFLEKAREKYAAQSPAPSPVRTKDRG